MTHADMKEIKTALLNAFVAEYGNAFHDKFPGISTFLESGDAAQQADYEIANREGNTWTARTTLFDAAADLISAQEYIEGDMISLQEYIADAKHIMAQVMGQRN